MTNFVISGVPAPTEPKTLQDLIQRPFKCAIHDLPFVATFVRNDQGIYVWRKSERMGLSGGVGQGEHGHNDTVDMSKLSFQGFTCAWCGAEGAARGHIVHCSGCREYVCVGRVKGTHFTCSDSCGTSGDITGTIKKMKMVDGISGNLDGTGRRQIGYQKGGG